MAAGDMVAPARNRDVDALSERDGDERADVGDRELVLGEMTAVGEALVDPLQEAGEALLVAVACATP
jgi:hypothetical protein